MCVNSANFAFLLKLFEVPIKKLRHTIQITNDRPIHRLNHQWQASIHFNSSLVGQYDVIFKSTIKCFVFKPSKSV